jgi:hypothetical protein
MKMRKGLLCFLAVVLLTAPIAVSQQPVEHKLDHFKLWAVTPVPFSASVALLGQFDNAQWWNANLTTIQYIGNPTNKTHGALTTKIANPKLHFVGYTLTMEKHQPRREVTIQNQFTARVPEVKVETWKIGDPAFLLLPAGKEFFPEPAQKQSGDHFACYAVIAPSTFLTKVTLQDQFDVKRDKDEILTALEPAYFCVPVQKRYAKDPVQPLLDAKTYLALYKIFPQDPWSRRINTTDQFGDRRLDVNGSRMLAVPTTQVDWKPAQ